MAGALAFSFSAAEQVTVALIVALVLIVAVLGYRAWRDRRITPEERERQRREMLVTTGKMGDATLVEVRDDLMFYAYLVRGVEYTASQDVSRLTEHLPPDLSVVTSVSVKYDARNPANSIILAEQWNGLHIGPRIHTDH